MKVKTKIVNYMNYEDEEFIKAFEEFEKSLSKRAGIGFVVLFYHILSLLVVGLAYKNQIR
jgi:hypothetical protein